MSWDMAMRTACRLARKHAGQRFYVVGFRRGSSYEWEYECRCAGPVTR